MRTALFRSAIAVAEWRKKPARALTKPLEAGGCRRHSVDLLVREAERAA